MDSSINPVVDIKKLQEMSDKLVEESSKIKFISKLINRALDVSKSNSSRLGTTIKKSAFILAIITTATIGGVILFALEGDNREYQNFVDHLMEKRQDWDLSSQEWLCLYGPVMLFFAFWFVIDSIGKNLENRPAWCKSGLAMLMKNWNKYPPSIPESVQELFSELVNDFDQKTRTFKTLDDKRAQEIVDRVLALNNALTQYDIAQIAQR